MVARDGVCRLFSRVLPLPHQEEAMSYKIAGIDVHKKVLIDGRGHGCEYAGVETRAAAIHNHA